VDFLAAAKRKVREDYMAFIEKRWRILMDFDPAKVRPK
jgi:hypothetical protein